MAKFTGWKTYIVNALTLILLLASAYGAFFTSAEAVRWLMFVNLTATTLLRFFTSGAATVGISTFRK